MGTLQGSGVLVLTAYINPSQTASRILASILLLTVPQVLFYTSQPLCLINDSQQLLQRGVRHLQALPVKADLRQLVRIWGQFYPGGFAVFKGIGPAADNQVRVEACHLARKYA